MTRLTDQPWLTDPATRAVMAALEAAGGEGCARFVGGCVRNALMGRPIDDIDIATTLTPGQTEKAIRGAGLKAVPTGIVHGTVTAVADRRPFEITTLRRDVTTDGRNATVAFTDDWAEDAARRDFRLNALYADAEGQVFDPTGQGVEDAAAGRIVFVGDPATRIREDYLRILRFFRFFAWYGQGEMDAPGLAACRELATGMTRLSAERVSKELMKLLAAEDPRPAIHAMARTGVLTQVLPDAADLALFDAVVDLTDDPVERLGAMLPLDADLLRRVAEGLRLPNATRDRMTDMAQAAADVDLDLTDHGLRVAVYRHGRRTVRELLTRRSGEDPARSVNGDRLRALAADWHAPAMPVGGKDVAGLGVPPGPETGRILKAFEAAWIADDFPVGGHAERLAALITPPRG